MRSDVVLFARSVVEAEVLGTDVRYVPEGWSSDPVGAFVTLNVYPSGELRGCIGYPMPVMSLEETISESGRASCHDPRFHPLSVEELDGVTVEVTLLTTPQIVTYSTPSELVDSIVVGRDGLMIEMMGHRGLLLPQVPVEWGWDAETFLDQLCVKAGLHHGAWKLPAARIWSFQGEIWAETSPRGEIIRI